jgi:hypothetical protein
MDESKSSDVTASMSEYRRQMDESKSDVTASISEHRRQMVDQCKSILKNKILLEKKRYAKKLTIDTGDDADDESSSEEHHSDVSTITSVTSYTPQTPGSQTFSTLMAFPSPLPNISDDEWSVSTNLIDVIPLYSPAFTVGTILSPPGNGNEHKVLWELNQEILEAVKQEDQYSDIFPFDDSHLRLKFSMKVENVAAIEIMLAHHCNLIEFKLKLEMDNVSEAKYLKFSNLHATMELISFELNHHVKKCPTIVAVTLYH